MNCDIIKDLLPLYVDGICSKETEQAVREHLKTCDACRTVYEDMCRAVIPAAPTAVPNEKGIYLRIRRQLGNFLICAIIAILVAAIAFCGLTEWEDHNWPQGVFSLCIIIPATGLLASMLNLFFCREYPSRPWFCRVSALITFGICVLGDLYAIPHYDYPENWASFIPLCLLVALIFSAISYGISKLYSRFCNS